MGELIEDRLRFNGRFAAEDNVERAQRNVAERAEAANEIEQLRKALVGMAEWIVGPGHDMGVPYLNPPPEEEFLHWYNQHIETINEAISAGKEKANGEG